jgi:hypothetical protein
MDVSQGKPGATATVYTFGDNGHTALWTQADEDDEVVRAFIRRPASVEIAGSEALAVETAAGA